LDVLIVKPGKEEIKRNQVAIWEPDHIHAQVDPKWEELGGAFVAGDSANPDKTYRVADTSAVREAIRKERLVLVEEVAEAASSAEKSPESQPASEPSPETLPVEEPPAEESKKSRR
jgi:hypothetical protein